MSPIPTYIVNLERSTTRKKYMSELLSPYNFLNVKFIPAIDGRILSEAERNEVFDSRLCMSRYGRMLNGGEMGCVLSHRKCYKTLLTSSADYALVFEDDIHPMRSLEELRKVDLDKILGVAKPIVLLLSGDYWYYKKANVANVYDAVGAYAYIINRRAAELILSIPKPYNVADDWALYKQYGVKLKAIMPYLIDANVNMDILGTDVHQDIWGIDKRKMSKVNLFRTIRGSILKKMFFCLGHFESKIRVINNKVVSN